jgi:hypothetical protein
MPEVLMGEVHPGLSYEEYVAIPAWNCSLLKLASSRSPAHAWAAYRDPNAPDTTDSSALVVGSVLHCLLLEPDQFNARYVLPPVDAPRRPTEKQLEQPTAKPGTKAYATWAEYCEGERWWQAFDAEHASKTVLSVKDHQMATDLHRTVLGHPALGPWFAPGPNPLNELTITWADPPTGAPCKARLDAVRLFLGCIQILDVKSALDASPGGFGRDAVKFGYLLQGAFYTDGLMECRQALTTLLDLPESAEWVISQIPVAFEFIVAEKAYPWLVARYFLTDDQLEAGRLRYREALRAVVAADATGYWPGYDSAALPLELPGWFK